MREDLGLLGGVLATSILLRYAHAILSRKAQPVSSASWAMWTILDVLLLITTWRAGKPVWLPLGWTIGATLVTISLLLRGEWVWSRKETLSLICATVATIAWQTQGAEFGVIAGTVALTCTGIPLLIDMARAPVRSSFSVWFTTCIACILTLLGSDGSFTGTFLSWGSLLYNATLSLLVLRTPRRIADEA